MRIVKERALALLNGEIRELTSQCRRCEGQIAKLSSWGLDSMSGNSVTAMEANVRMRIAIVRAQLVLFQSLRAADQKNARLIASLPTTSPGVLDTALAQERVDRARRRVLELTLERDRIVAVSDPAVRAKIRYRYQQLIKAQWSIVKSCQRILERANQYSRDALNTYRSVSVDAAQYALTSCDSFSEQGHWGQTEWVGLLFLRRDLNVRQASEASRAAGTSPIERLMDGDLKDHANFASAKAELNRAGASQVAVGELLGLSVSAKPYKDTRQLVDKDRYELGLGISGEAEFNVASGSVTETSGLLTGSVSASLLKETLSGEIGASLYGEEGFNPSFAASVTSSAAVVEAAAKTSLGGDHYNAYAGVSGKALTAEATAGVSYGEEGAMLSVGAETYAAQGAVSGGVTFLGVNVGVSVKGAVGGAGGEAMARIGKTAFEGEVALGLGIGVGAKVTIDWGGFGSAAENLRADIANWWDSLTRGEDVKDRDEDEDEEV